MIWRVIRVLAYSCQGSKWESTHCYLWPLSWIVLFHSYSGLSIDTHYFTYPPNKVVTTAIMIPTKAVLKPIMILFGNFRSSALKYPQINSNEIPSKLDRFKADLKLSIKKKGKTTITPATVEARNVPRIILKASQLDVLLILPISARCFTNSLYNPILDFSSIFLSIVSSSSSLISGIAASLFSTDFENSIILFSSLIL